MGKRKVVRVNEPTVKFERNGKNKLPEKVKVIYNDGSKVYETVNYGSQIKFDTTVMRNGKSFELVNSSYDEPDELTFQICKDPEKFSSCA